MRILVYLSTITFWLTYLFFLSTNAFGDIPRYFLFMVPVFIAASLAALYEVFSNRNITFSIALTLPMLFSLWIQSTLSIEKGGVYVSYGLPKLNWTGAMLIIQLIAYVAIVLANVTRKNTIRLSYLSKKSRRLPVSVQKLTLSSLVIVMLVSANYFSVYSLSNSNYFKENNAKITKTLFEDVDLNNKFVISNFQTYMRPYATDNLLNKSCLFPPPMTEDEFRQLLRIAPNGSLIVVSHDPRLAWYEYANSYIKKYTKTDVIPLSAKTERITYDGLLLDLRLGSMVNSTIYDVSGNAYMSIIYGGNITNGFFEKAVRFNGENDYASVNYLEFPNTYSVEIWFKLEVQPSDFGFMDDGTPVCKMLLAKRYRGYAELMLSIINEGEIQALAKNENNDVRFNFKSPKGLIEANNWYHTVLTVDECEAKLYLNGMLVGESEVKGLNQRLADYPESGEEPLKIGADGTSAFTRYRYFPGCIEGIQ